MGRQRKSEHIITAVLQQYGEALTCDELAELIPSMPIGTISGRLSQMTREGKVVVHDIYQRPRRYQMNNAWEPSSEEKANAAFHQAQIHAKVEPEPEWDDMPEWDEPEPVSSVVVPVDQHPVVTWVDVVDMWWKLFGVKVNPQDARMMVEVASKAMNIWGP